MLKVLLDYLFCLCCTWDKSIFSSWNVWHLLLISLAQIACNSWSVLLKGQWVQINLKKMCYSSHLLPPRQKCHLGLVEICFFWPRAYTKKETFSFLSEMKRGWYVHCRDFHFLCLRGGWLLCCFTVKFYKSLVQCSDTVVQFLFNLITGFCLC